MQSLRILSELAVVTAKNRQTVIKYKNDQKKYPYALCRYGKNVGRENDVNASVGGYVRQLTESWK